MRSWATPEHAEAWPETTSWWPEDATSVADPVILATGAPASGTGAGIDNAGIAVLRGSATAGAQPGADVPSWFDRNWQWVLPVGAALIGVTAFVARRRTHR